MVFFVKQQTIMKIILTSQINVAWLATKFIFQIISLLNE